MNWLKLKKDYLDDLGDSMDLVVVGADYGSGKRVGWFASFLLACYDEASGKFQTICKCGSGFTDERYNELKALMSKLTIDKPDPSVVFREVIKDGVRENAI
jgi:DNA ligase-1